MTTESKKAAKPGIIYCVCNPLFPHLVKIGKKPVFDEAFLPENFELLWKYEVNDIDATVKSVHKACEDFSYKPKEKGDFFYKCAAEKAKQIVEPFSNNIKADAKSHQKKKRSSFKDANIPIGAKLSFHADAKENHRNQGKEVEVVNDKNQVILDGKIMAISPAAVKLFDGDRRAANGFDHFKYKGKLITEILE